MNLVEIIDKFNLDVSTDKNSVHSYITGFYENEFLKYKNKKITILEVGIRRGGSMKLWSEYFTKANSVIGIDISSNEIENQYRNINGVEYLFGNAYSAEIVNKIPELDIFLDDGPHTKDSQIDSIRHYLPKVKSGGIFIIEDVQDIEWFNFFDEEVDNIRENDSSFNYKVECVDLRHLKNKFGDYRYDKDDLLYVVRKTKKRKTK